MSSATALNTPPATPQEPAVGFATTTSIALLDSIIADTLAMILLTIEFSRIFLFF